MATSPVEGVSIRAVRLKVLYTFDIEQKDNHLARWPHPLEVQTAWADESNQIGIIDLRTCLEAVTTASPELAAQLDNDYTVYAYDYSEPDSPLVGQGMLSKHLASQGNGAADDMDSMVTGRITKNMMGIFARTAQETLEVKLKLTPVSTFQRRHRSGSVSSQDGGRSQWQGLSAPSPSQQYQRSASPTDTAGLESIQRSLTHGSDRRGSLAGDSVNMEIGSVPRASSRPGTPTSQQNYNAPMRQGGNGSRPSSRAGTRPPAHGRRDSFNSGYYSGDDQLEEGPARKRAKIQKVDWPSKSNLNIERQPDSLRVMASTASSVRIHRPIAVNPALQLHTGQSAEEPIRPPTPVPVSKSTKPRGRPRKNPTSNLVNGSQVRDSSPNAPAVAAPQPDLLNVSFNSPDESRARSVSSTPANIPSSPPVMTEQPPLITSPALPPIITNHDSGFMSGTLDDIFGDDQVVQFDDFILDKPDDFNDDAFRLQNNQQGNYVPTFEEGIEVEEPKKMHSSSMDPPPLPTLAPAPAAIQSRTLSRTQSYTPISRVSMSSPRLAPAPVPRARQMMEEERAKAALPAPAHQAAPVPMSDPPPRTLQRAATWAPDSDAVMSDAPTAADTRTRGRKKVGKEQTKARLESAIENGEMPPFCANCGAIETPAWRRGYSRIFTCSWDDVETSLEPGECCFKEVLETNPDGSVKSFKGYKVEKKAEDKSEDWVTECLCNPCGLWLHKQKCPRPPSKWSKRDPKAKQKRKRNPKPSKKALNGNSSFRTDEQTPASDDSSPADTATEAPDGDENDNDFQTNDEYVADDQEPQLPPMPRTTRANSADPGPRGLQARIQQNPGAGRQVQSSPGHAVGSEGAPVEIDLTPKPVRRQLFPSPDKVQVCPDPGQTIALARTESELPTFIRRSPRLNKTRDAFEMPATAVAITVDGKENAGVETNLMVHDGLNDLFEDDGLEVQAPPMTPTPKRRSERLIFKTPSRTPGREFGAELSANAADLLPTFRTPKSKQSQHPVVSALLGTVQKRVEDMTPFSRSIHDLMSGAPSSIHEPEPARTRSAKKRSPNKDNMFDFPDLPSLKNSSPISQDHLLNFNFSELTTDQLTSEFHDPFNSAMPSSPPAELFKFIEHEDDMRGMWDEIIAPGEAVEPGSEYPDPDALSAAPAPGSALRRSPRKQAVK